MGLDWPGKKGSGFIMSLRILLVEDHEDTAEVTARLLKGCGHIVLVANSYAMAMQESAAGFDLLLTDIGLPDRSGIEVFRDLRRHATFRSIALTAYGMPAEVQQCLDAGFDAHLLKPIDFGKLEAVIDQLTWSATPAREANAAEAAVSSPV
jgi:CheY-like chemotaxis protein